MKEALFIKRSCCASRIQESSGRHFWVKFRKKNGEIRELEGEVRPPKENPKALSPAAYNPDLILVGDRHIYHELKSKGVPEEKAYNDSYRCVTISQLIEFRIENVNYYVEDDDNG